MPPIAIVGIEIAFSLARSVKTALVPPTPMVAFVSFLLL